MYFHCHLKVVNGTACLSNTVAQECVAIDKNNQTLWLTNKTKLCKKLNLFSLF